MTIEINQHTFELLPEKALYKPDEQLLIIADVHLGKANHFRKEGISIPAHAQLEDYRKLEELFGKTTPRKVYFLGDLFHSTFNRDWHYFCDLVAAYPSVSFTLVKGNHDIIDHRKFGDICVHVTDAIEDGSFVYSHEPVERLPFPKVNIIGHVHPGIVLSGQARQHIKLPCFYLTPSTFMLPAFGVLTGLYPIQPGANDTVFAVIPGGIRRVK